MGEPRASAHGPGGGHGGSSIQATGASAVGSNAGSLAPGGAASGAGGRSTNSLTTLIR